MKRIGLIAILCALGLTAQSNAQGIPLMVNYQGHVKDGGLPYDGAGYFKFALVNSGGSTTYWTNDGTASGEPANSVSLNVTGGLFAVNLGDTSVTNMTAVPVSAVTSPDIRPRVWFSTTNPGPYQLLAPDRQLTSVPYAYKAESLSDSAQVTTIQDGRTFSEIAAFGLASGLGQWVPFESNNSAYSTGTKSLLIKDITYFSSVGGIIKIAYNTSGGPDIVAFAINTLYPNTHNIESNTYSLASGIVIPPDSTIKFQSIGTNDSLTVSGYELNSVPIWSKTYNLPDTAGVPTTIALETLVAGEKLVITDVVFEKTEIDVTLQINDGSTTTKLLRLNSTAPAKKTPGHISFAAGLPVGGPVTLEVSGATNTPTAYLFVAGYRE